MKQCDEHFLRGLPVIILMTLFICGSIRASEPGQDEYLYARKLFDEKYYDLAAEQLERVLRDYPSISEAEEAHYLLGEAYLKAGDFEHSRAAFLRFAITFPKSPRAPEAMFKVGSALEKIQLSADAAEAYARVQGFYPKSQFAVAGLNRAIEIYLAIGDSIQAESRMDLMLDKYPSSEAADVSRFYKALILIKRGDRELGRRHLEWIAQRSTIDSIAAAAWLELGRIMRDRFELYAATEAFKQPVVQYPETRHALIAAVELADLYNYRGLTSDALELLKPVLRSSDENLLTSARIKAGDAYYRKSDYKNALSCYSQTAESNLEGALKTAWTLEMSGEKDKAFARYLQISSAKSEHAIEAGRRAAIISSELGQWDRSAQLWFRIISNAEYEDSTGRTSYELVRARANTGQSVRSAAQRALARYKSSPYNDEIAYFNYSELLRYSLDEKNPKIPDPRKNLINYPASAWLDSTVILYDYFLRHQVRSENLIEQMAELSSKHLGSVKKAKWALDWGDFYLHEFKDPVKALDQYSIALDQVVISTEDLLYAYQRSLEAYLFLYEGSLWEGDDFSMRMYADSSRSWLNQLIEVDPDGQRTADLTAELLRLDLVRFWDSSEQFSKTLDKINTSINEFGINKLPVTLIVRSLSCEIAIGFIDSSEIVRALEIANTALNSARDARIISRLSMLGILLHEMIGQYDEAYQAALKLVATHPETPGGAEAVSWLMENPRLSPQQRYEWFERFISDYPYLIETGIHYQLATELLDSLNRPLEALAARQQVRAAINWSLPRLDILEITDENSAYYRAKAYQKALKPLEAQEGFRILLNLNPEGEFAARCYLSLAEIKYHLNNIQMSIAYLDTLNRRFPSLLENRTGMRLRPVVLMADENYEEALWRWNELIASEENTDSLIIYKEQAVICMYRLNRLDEARDQAKEIYKLVQNEEDLNRYKALFYLEKGHALDRFGNYDKARKQYDLIIESYSFTQWADDAAYSRGRSLIQQGKIDEGIVELERFAENYPDSSLTQDALLTIGLTAYKSEKFSEAVSALKKVWARDSGKRLWNAAFKSLINVYKAARFWDAAIQLCRDYLARFPDAEDRLDRQMDIGWFYLQLGRWNDAINQYGELLPIADAEQEAEVQFYLGEAYMLKGDYNTAILEYMKVKVLGRKTKLDWGVTALYKAGICYEKLGESENAARMYRMIIAEQGETSNYGIAAKKRLETLPLK